RLAKRFVTCAKVQERIGGNRDDCEQIVEVMSNAAGKTTDRLHLLGLTKLLLEELTLRNVFNNGFKPGETTVARSHNPAAETNLNRGPVLRLPFGFKGVESILRFRCVDQSQTIARIFVDGIEIEPLQFFDAVVPQHRHECWIDIQDCP